MLITIATFSFPHEAHLAKSRLDAIGIPSFIADEHTINMDWLYSNALGGVRLQVPREFAAQALEALSDPIEIEPIPELEEEPEPRPPTCPSCGSPLGEPYPSGKRPAVLVWLFLGLPLWPAKPVRKCPACGRVTPA